MCCHVYTHFACECTQMDTHRCPLIQNPLHVILCPRYDVFGKSNDGQCPACVAEQAERMQAVEAWSNTQLEELYRHDEMHAQAMMLQYEHGRMVEAAEREATDRAAAGWVER